MSDVVVTTLRRALRRAVRPVIASCACLSGACPAWIASFAGVAAVLALSGCGDDAAATRFAQIGDPERGAAEIEQIGCGSCHRIPGIAGANGLVGPPLDLMGRRVFIAGMLRNTPANMVTWLLDPQKIVPGNAMPDMGLSEEQARDITAYLYTLQ